MEKLILENLEGKESKWVDVLKHVLPIASHIEFNILYSDRELKEFFSKYEDSIEELIKKKKKIYSSGKVVRLRLTEEVISFLKSKSYSDYKNWILEDPSLYINDVEVAATISHEDQIYLRPDFIDVKLFENFKLEIQVEEEDGIGLWAKIMKYFKR